MITTDPALPQADAAGASPTDSDPTTPRTSDATENMALAASTAHTQTRTSPMDLASLLALPENEESAHKLADHFKSLLVEGDGETLVDVGPCEEQALDQALARIQATATQLQADFYLIYKVQSSAKGEATDSHYKAHALVRLPPSSGRHLNLRVAVVGNVDAGKSTLVGVLTTGMLDNGRGSARLKVLRHKHEAETGRTSSISEDQHMGFDTKGNIVNNPSGTQQRNSQWTEVVEKSSKVVSFIDLAGHEKYLKTTMFGMTAHDPDYALVVVGANHGVTRMTKEHLGVAIALNVPVFVVVTKVDLCPENVLKQSVQQLVKLLKLPGARKKPYIVRSMDDMLLCASAFTDTAMTPVFTVSNVTGLNMDTLRSFINLLPARKHWSLNGSNPVEFLIDQHFNVPGIGTVVAGTLVNGIVNTGHLLVLGPDSTGTFKQVVVKSIHHMRVATSTLLTGQSGAFLVRAVKRKEHIRSMGLRKGMVLMDPSSEPAATWRFECDVVVLHSSTTMRCNYQPVLHTRNVRQSARIAKMDKDVLRTGTKAHITFEFLFRPELIREGARLIFREGKTKGIGTITRILETAKGGLEDTPADPTPPVPSIAQPSPSTPTTANTTAAT